MSRLIDSSRLQSRVDLTDVVDPHSVVAARQAKSDASSRSDEETRPAALERRLL
jgi:hypothetical protein